MQTSRRNFLRLSGTALIAAAVSNGALVERVAALRASRRLPTVGDPQLHFLNRISYGTRPDEVERVRQIGIEAYLDEQLDPESIDDAEMEALLMRNPILFMSRQDSHALGFDGRVQQALENGMIGRAVASKRQLLERMVEFWTDHFNIPSEDLGHDLIIMHREVFRRHALGKFRDLAIAVAQHPAMLYYLDQTYSDKEHPNENYARELLELHTLGVDGGHYTETDVKEAARALTGWTVNDATETGFYFNHDMHDSDAKTILGHTFPAGRGIEDGLHLLSLLVNHPATAAFICQKLCIRFVTDHPPESLIQSMVQVWAETDGAIIPVLRQMFLSTEFQDSAGQKLRRPLDFFIGVMRATGTTFRQDSQWQRNEMLDELGQPPYGWAPPNGYPDVAVAWLNTSGLMARWNAAMRLTHAAYSEQWSGMDTQLRQRIGAPETVGALVDAVAAQVFGVPLSDPADRAPFVAFVTEDGDENMPVTASLLSAKLGTLYGLMLASPQYQWR